MTPERKALLAESMSPTIAAIDGLAEWIDGLIREAEAGVWADVRRSLSMSPTETLHDYILRMQAEVNRLRDLAVAKTKEAAARVAAAEASRCRLARIAAGDLERNYYGGGLESSEKIEALIRAMKEAE